MNSGTLISRYRIVRSLGRGGMGIVYLADDLRLGRQVALKFLPQEHMGEDEQKRFLHEARAAAQVRHPNICPIYDIEEAEGRNFLAMAYLDGETLAQRIQAGPMEISRVIDYGRQIANGLDAAHALGIVHRDVKCKNLMVDAAGHVSILDFGLALRSGEERLTLVGQAVGTPAYMSPEQMRGETVDARTDLFSFGVVLFELAHGRLPKEDERFLGPLGEIIAKAVARKPQDRWQSAREMGAALERVGVLSDTRTMPYLVAEPKKARWMPVAVGLVAVGSAGWGLSALLSKPAVVVKPVTEQAAAVRRVIVMPLTVSGEREQVVSDGLTEVFVDAIEAAGRTGGNIWAVPMSEVRSRKLVSVEEARRVYGVDLAIVGIAESSGDDVRMALRLVDAANQKTLGEQSLTYAMKTPVASKDLAVGAVTRLLALPEQKASAVSGNEAYAAYLEGRGLMARYDKSGNVEKAIAHFERAIAGDGRFALAYASLGEAYWRKASLTKGDEKLAKLALENARRGVELDPKLAIAHVKLGQILGASGKEAEGIEQLRRALEITPGSAEAEREMGKLYAVLGRFPDAEASLRRSIEDRPTDWRGYLELAFFYEDRGRLDEAVASLRKGEALTPENTTLLRNLGRIYRMQGHYGKAVEQFQRAVAVQPLAATYNSLGLTYYYLHDYPRAVEAIELAIEMDSEFSQFWGNLGAATMMEGASKAKSTASFRKAIELAEGHLKVTPNAYSWRADLAEYRARLGDKAGAMREIGAIPEASRSRFLGRLVTAYEALGLRSEAIAAFEHFANASGNFQEILDEPVLANLVADRRFQAALTAAKTKTAR